MHTAPMNLWSHERTLPTDNRHASLLLGLALLLLYPLLPAVLTAQEKPTPGQWGAQSDGTYINPIMPGDFSDLDAIRVGEEFYAISSTMQYAPGMAILHSRDLVNWSIVGHVVDDLTKLSPEMNWDRMARAGRGIWAGSIRFHSGRFYVYFGTPDEGIFMSSAVDPAGRWTPLSKVLAAPGWDDPCPFWDDDGRGYLVLTRFQADPTTGKKYNIHLFSLNPAWNAVLPESDAIIHQSQGSEANKLYKIRGLYFHFYSEVRAEGRVPMIERAATLTGPWESRQLMHVNKKVDKEPNQGGLIELPDARWYFVTHQGTGDWEGRAGDLLPVTWHDGWPAIGEIGSDGIGNMVWRAQAPLPFIGSPGLVTDDDFAVPALKPQWEWHYQPRADAWSLLPKEHALRMQAFAPLRPSDFHTVGNVLTQRALRTSSNVVTVKLSLSHMADGQHAGLAHFAKTDAELEVVQDHGVRRLALAVDGVRTQGPSVSTATILLRSQWDLDGQCHFFYSVDGKSFAPLGPPYQLTWGSYRGDRVGLFTYNETAARGSVDFLAFSYVFSR